MKPYLVVNAENEEEYFKLRNDAEKRMESLIKTLQDMLDSETRDVGLSMPFATLYKIESISPDWLKPDIHIPKGNIKIQIPISTIETKLVTANGEIKLPLWSISNLGRIHKNSPSHFFVAYISATEAIPTSHPKKDYSQHKFKATTN